MGLVIILNNMLSFDNVEDNVNSMPFHIYSIVESYAIKTIYNLINDLTYLKQYKITIVTRLQIHVTFFFAKIRD